MSFAADLIAESRLEESLGTAEKDRGILNVIELGIGLGDYEHLGLRSARDTIGGGIDRRSTMLKVNYSGSVSSIVGIVHFEHIFGPDANLTANPAGMEHEIKSTSIDGYLGFSLHISNSTASLVPRLGFGYRHESARVYMLGTGEKRFEVEGDDRGPLLGGQLVLCLGNSVSIIPSITYRLYHEEILELNGEILYRIGGDESSDIVWELALGTSIRDRRSFHDDRFLYLAVYMGDWFIR
jgi:hypothetical protein